MSQRHIPFFTVKFGIYYFHKSRQFLPLLVKGNKPFASRLVPYSLKLMSTDKGCELVSIKTSSKLGYVLTTYMYMSHYTNTQLHLGSLQL